MFWLLLCDLVIFQAAIILIPMHKYHFAFGAERLWLADGLPAGAVACGLGTWEATGYRLLGTY